MRVFTPPPHTHTQTLRFIFLFFICTMCTKIYVQDYYVIAKPGYDLGRNTSQRNLDIAYLNQGLYHIVLVCNGELYNSKTLIKN